MKSLGLNVFFFLLSGFVFGQVNSDIAILPDLFYKNYYLLNAAKSDTSKGPQLAFGNRSATGVFSGISENYVTFNTTIATDNPIKHHSLGFYVHNNNIGEYIQNNRFYGRYSYTSPLGVNSALSLGAHVGVVNYYFKPSIASGGGSAFAPDLGLGLWYWTGEFGVGVAVNQILNSHLQPMTQVYLLNRYYTLSAKTQLELSPNVKAEFHGMAAFFEYLEYYKVQVSPLLVINRLLEAGGSYQLERGVLGMLGLRNARLGGGNLSFSISYLALNMSKTYNFNDATLEFFMGYHF